MDPCRICLKPKPSDFLTNILTATFQYVSYRHIYSYFGTVLEEHKEFPLVICRDCEFQLISAYKFKMKCLEAEIKISLILQAKSQIDNPTDDDESNRLECLIELNTLAQPQEMEINLISSFINVPEILSIDDERGDPNFALNTSASVIELSDQFNDPNVDDCESAIVKYNSTDILPPDPFTAVPKDHISPCEGLNIYPKCHILLDHIPIEIQPLESYHELQRENWIKCRKCGEEMNSLNLPPDEGECEVICDHCRQISAVNSIETPEIVSNNAENHQIEEKTVENPPKINKKPLKRVKKSQFLEKKLDNSYEKCEICGSYIKSINICRHLELHQSKADNKKYPCHICGKTFAVRYYANDHVKRMHGKSKENESDEIIPKKHFKCNICEKDVRKYFWKRHMDSHRTANRSFNCEICEKSFISRDTIRAHMITVHLKKKRYDCFYCGEKFIHSLTRYRHINKHHLKKPAANCSLCSATFYHRTSLVAHRRKFHPPSVTLKCHVCNAIFFDRRHLKKHIHTTEYQIGQIMSKEEIIGPEVQEL